MQAQSGMHVPAVTSTCLPRHWHPLACRLLAGAGLLLISTVTATIAPATRSRHRHLGERCQVCAPTQEGVFQRDDRFQSYRGFFYPHEVTQYAVWLYHLFSLTLRGVKDQKSIRENP